MVYLQDIPYNYNYRTRQVVRSWGPADSRIKHTEDEVRRVERKDFATLYDEFNKNNEKTIQGYNYNSRGRSNITSRHRGIFDIWC